MKQGIGMSVYPGVAIGKAVVYRKQQNNAPVEYGTPAQE